MKTSFCRICPNSCPVLVEVEDGRAVNVTGDPSNEVWQGYTCVKGRKLPELHNHPDRLLHHQKRMPDGTYVSISSEQLLDELATHVRELIDESGPNAIASYFGTMATVSPTITPMMTAFNKAIGSTMTFNPFTIDQPGKLVAKGLHGAWMAPPQAFNTPDVGLFFGANPLVTYAMGLPAGHPGKWLQRWSEKGLQLIVVDPRRTDTAKRAKIHLQCRPGHDAEILAGIIRVILTEGLQDHAFVAENVDRRRGTDGSGCPLHARGGRRARRHRRRRPRRSRSHLRLGRIAGSPAPEPVRTCPARARCWSTCC